MNPVDQLTRERIAEFLGQMADNEIAATPQPFLADAEALGEQTDFVVCGIPCVRLGNVIVDGWIIPGESPVDSYVLTPAGTCYHLMQSSEIAAAATSSEIPLTPTLALGRASGGDPDVISRHHKIHDALDNAADVLIGRMSDAMVLDEIVPIAVDRFLSKMDRLHLPPEDQTFKCRLNPDDELLDDHYGDQAELAAQFIREPMPNVSVTGWLVDLPHYPHEQYEDRSFVITDEGTVFALIQSSELAGRHLSPEEVKPADPVEFGPLADRYLDDEALAQAVALLLGIDHALAIPEEPGRR